MEEPPMTTILGVVAGWLVLNALVVFALLTRGKPTKRVKPRWWRQRRQGGKEGCR
jgi:hypothetical protein